MSKQTIGEFLATLRKEKGYTQQQVADALGVSNRTVSVWETGKAYPDILTLPSIAELYGVTVDEILRGERAQGSGNTAKTHEILRPYQADAFRNVLARSAVQCDILTGVGVGCALLLLIMAAVGGYAPSWLVVLALVLAVIGYVIGITLGIVFDRSALASAGVYSDRKTADGKTDEKSDGETSDGQSRFVFALRKGELRALKRTGLVWLASGIAELLLFVVLDAYFDLGWVLPIVTFLGGLGALVAAGVVGTREINARGDEETKRVRRANGKLLKKCVLFFLVPAVALMGALVLCDGCYVRYRIVEEYSAPYEEFVRTMHTFAVSDSLGQEYGVETGEFYADLTSVLSSEDFAYNQTYPLGGGFSCRFAVLDCVIEVRSTDGNRSMSWCVEPLHVYEIAEDGTCRDLAERIYDLRTVGGNGASGGMAQEGLFLVSRWGLSYEVEVRDGVYMLLRKWGEDYANVVYPTGVLVSAAIVVAGAAVYRIRRKKTSS